MWLVIVMLGVVFRFFGGCLMMLSRVFSLMLCWRWCWYVVLFVSWIVMSVFFCVVLLVLCLIVVVRFMMCCSILCVVCVGLYRVVVILSSVVLISCWSRCNWRFWCCVMILLFSVWLVVICSLLLVVCVCGCNGSCMICVVCRWMVVCSVMMWLVLVWKVLVIWWCCWKLIFVFCVVICMNCLVCSCGLVLFRFCCSVRCCKGWVVWLVICCWVFVMVLWCMVNRKLFIGVVVMDSGDVFVFCWFGLFRRNVMNWYEDFYDVVFSDGVVDDYDVELVVVMLLLWWSNDVFYMGDIGCLLLDGCCVLC